MRNHHGNTGPGKLSSYVPKVAQSWRVAGDNQDDWADGTRRTIESFVNNSNLGGPYGYVLATTNE